MYVPCALALHTVRYISMHVFHNRMDNCPRYSTVVHSKKAAALLPNYQVPVGSFNCSEFRSHKKQKSKNYMLSSSNKVRSQNLGLSYYLFV